MDLDFAKALVALRKDLGSTVARDSKNSHFKSRYASLQAVLDKAHPILCEHGFVLLNYVDTPFEGASYTSVLRTVLVHAATGQELDLAYPLIPSKNYPQGMGSAITYATRYQTMALLGWAPADDDDGEAASGRSKAAKKPQASVPATSITEDLDNAASSSDLDAVKKRILAETASGSPERKTMVDVWKKKKADLDSAK